MTDSPEITASGPQAVAVGTNHGVVSTGDGTVIDNRTLNLPPEAFTTPAEVTAPEGLNNLPAPHSPVFVDRQTDMAHLRAALGAAPPTSPPVVHGLGGMGKSTLALHFAHQHRERFNPIWWIPAETPNSVAGALTDLAARLSPHENLAFSTSAEGSAWAINWLQTHQGWLLIFDDVASPHDLAPVIGPLSTGRHLITSRRAVGWHRLGKPLALDILPSDAAVDMLMRIIEPDDPDASDLEELAAELGYLPIALEQAAAYIQYTAITSATYLERLRLHPARLFAVSAPSGASREADDQRTVARIWQLSLAAINAEQPLASDLLRTLAWFASEDLPRDLLYARHDDPIAVDEALALLQAYSMITLTPRVLSVHRLVQTVARTPDPSDPQRAVEAIVHAQQKAVDLLMESLPENPLFNARGWARWRELLPHIQTLATLVIPDQDTAKTASIFRETSGFLQSQGYFGQAVAYAQRAIDAFTRDFGRDSQQALAAGSFLASAHRAAGDYASALPLYLENLAACERTLGADHLDTLASRSNLAYLYALMGETAHALALQQRILDDHERILGPDHPHTLNAVANLASSCRAAGELTRATELFEQTLADHERVLGVDHSETLTVRSNLAYTCQLANDFARAISLQESVLADRERLLGPEHPHTAKARELLSEARDAQSG